MLRIKRVHTVALREEVYALRYRAYRRENAILESANESFEDRYDSQPNCVLWALTENEKLVGSIRTCWYEPFSSYPIPEMQSYSSEISSFIPSDARIFSGSRFVVESIVRGKSRYVMQLLKYHVMTFVIFKCDWAVAGVRPKHLSFYQNTLNLEPISDSRIYPGLTCSMHLMACDFKQNIQAVYENNPALKPRGYERLFFDDGYQDIWEVGLPVEI